MLLVELRRQSKELTKLWSIILGVQFFCFVITAIISSASSPKSNTWLFEFLTLTKGLPNDSSIRPMGCAIAFLFINLFLTAVDFMAGYSVHREIRNSFKKTHSDHEHIVLEDMRKKLKWVLTLIVVAFFMQCLHGFLWWVVGGLALLYKYFFFKEMNYLAPKKIVTETGTEILVH